MEQMELQQRIEAEIAALPETLRIAFVFAVLEEIPYREVAQILDLSMDAVRMRISRARKILRERLGPYLICKEG